MRLRDREFESIYVNIFYFLDVFFVMVIEFDCLVSVRIVIFFCISFIFMLVLWYYNKVLLRYINLYKKK